MWWFFVRDFYRLGAALPEAGNLVAPASTIQPRSVAELVSNQLDTSEPPRPVIPAIPSNIISHCHRAASEGAQAFGVWEADAGFTMFSANWSKVTGVRTEYSGGFNLIHQLAPEDQYAFHQALEAGAKAEQELRIRVRVSEHGYRSLACECLPPTPEQPHMIVLMRDVTETTQLMEDLHAKELALAHANHSRSAFLSCMSHELRTPLNAIIGFAAMMRDGVLGKIDHPAYEEYANHIHESGMGLLQRISDLLEIAAIDAGGVRLEESDICLDSLANELLEMHSHRLFERDISLNIHMHGMRIVADRRKTLCALNHLLANAMTHSPDGGTIQLYSSMAPDGALTISVRDYGNGMKPEHVTRIRHALASGVSYAHIREDGIGLGLSLSHEIMQQHEGGLSIDGSRLEGTIVNLHFPAARVPNARPQPRLVKS